MKTKSLVLALLALGLPGLTSCTTSQPVARNTDVDISTPGRRSYSQNELRKRGRPTVAESLEAQDASVQIGGR